MRDRGFSNMMEVIAKSWRTHKSKIMRNFIDKSLEPFNQHEYILLEDWSEFVTLKQSSEAKAANDRYKMLRQRNLHNHCLGTIGYNGKLQRWEAEDADLSSKGITNPWNNFPEGCPRNWLRARSKLARSEDSADIIWTQETMQKVSEEIKEKQSAAESSGITWVRENDVLAACLGPEEPDRVRGVSSYHGWKYAWPECSSMYRKRKRINEIDVEAIKSQVKEEVTAQVKEEITAQVRLEVTTQVTQEV